MDEKASEELQRNNWGALGLHIDTVVRELHDSNLEESLRSLLEVNVVRGDKLVVRYILKYQLQNNEPTLYAAFSSILSSQLPEYGKILAEEAAIRFIDGYRAMDGRKATAMVTLLAEMFNYEIIHEIVLLQILHILLENLEEMSLGMVIKLLQISGKRLLEVSKTAHNMVFEKLREVLQEGKLSPPLSKSLESLFDLRRTNYQSVTSNWIKTPQSNVQPHTFMLDEEVEKHSRSIGNFEYDSNFLETEKLYDDWKHEALHVLEARELEQQEDEQPPIVVKDMTSKDNIEFKKKIYLILKSSLSSDEAAHKIFKLRIPDAEKNLVVDIIVKSGYQEPTFSKFYGLLSERLCASHKSWKPAFEYVFADNYDHSDELEPAQLRTTGKFWGHLLASDYMGFEVFRQVHLNEDETNPPQRVLLKFILLELVAELGIDELKDRFEEEYIQPFVRGLFPREDAAHIRYSINYFTAIGLGVLTEKMRDRLTIVKRTESTATEDIPITARPNSKEEDIPPQAGPPRESRFRNTAMRPSTRERSRTPPRRTRTRNRSVTPPRRRNRSRSP